MAYFEKTNIADEHGNIITPVTDETVILLRRMVKILENQQAVDPQQRQRITVDAITAGVSLPAVTAITNALPAGTNAIGAVTNLATLAGYDQRLYSDWARAAYNTGIRQNLIFS